MTNQVAEQEQSHPEGVLVYTDGRRRRAIDRRGFPTERHLTVKISYRQAAILYLLKRREDGTACKSNEGRPCQIVGIVLDVLNPLQYRVHVVGRHYAIHVEAIVNWTKPVSRRDATRLK